MDQSQQERTVGAPSSSRSYQFHPARAAIVDLFNLYLGRGNLQKPDEPIRDPPNKSQKRVHAPVRDLPPRNDQFIVDFEKLQTQFNDPDQLRAITESVVISMVLQCSNHAPRAEFLLFALRTLCRIGCVNWDTFLPSLLSSVSAAEASLSQAATAAATPSQSLVPVGVGSPGNEPTALSKSLDVSANVQQIDMRNNSQRVKAAAINSLRQLSCKIILIGVEFNLKPATHAEIFQCMMSWLVNWDKSDDSPGKTWRSEKSLAEWLRSCLEVIWLLVDVGKFKIPFYELLRSGLQFIENIPDDEALFALVMEIHRRRDAMAMHMLMLDQHLHCPTFGTHRISSPTTANVSAEAVAHLRYSPITYPSVLGEPLSGEDLAMSVPQGSLDWERAVRCIKHAIRTTPSPEWWKRVLVVAPCYRPSAQAGPIPGAVFTSEMICEAIIDRIVELLKLTNSDANCWQEWLVFSDIFFFLIKSGCTDFVDFIDKLVLRLNGDDNHILRTNHVTWLLAQIIRVELVMTALNSDPRKAETTRKILSFHREDRADPNNPQSVLLDFVSSCQNLRIWSLSATTRAYLNNEQLLKGKQIDEWWRSKGERMMDYMNLDDRSIGMFWVVSYTMAQPACETVINWLSSAGVAELLPGVPPNERTMMMQEVSPLPMSLLSGFSMNLCLKLALQMEEALFVNQLVVPSIAMVETYTRLLLISPHSMFRSHFTQIAQRNASLLSKPPVTLLVLEILNYRLLPLYRYQGKTKSLMYDVTKILSALKVKRSDHRVFRLAENLCMNLILSLRDFFSVKRDQKGPTDFTETLSRITIMTLAITIKTRGIADADHLVYLQTMLEQVLATSQHTWSEKTLRHFPSLLRDALIGRVDKRGLSIQAWQQAETTVLNQCTQLLSPAAEPSYVMTYLSHSFPQHRQYLCAGACLLMQGNPDKINSANLARVLREVTPDEVTANIYTFVDVLLHNVHVDLQRGHGLEEILNKNDANLAFFFWTHEMLPLDIFLLALIDRDDDPHALIIAKRILERPELLQRINVFCVNRGNPEHWLCTQVFKRNELQKALGNHLSWKDNWYPTFFDDIAARLLPVIPLVVYRLIENNAMDTADKILTAYSNFLAYHPFRFTFVRDILAYFYGHLPGQLVVKILRVLGLSKIPFSESFPQYITHTGPATCPPLDYFANLLLNLVNYVIPPLSSSSSHCSSRSGSMADILNTSSRPPHGKTPGASQPGPANASEGQKAFYQIQDPGTYTQLVLETAVIEILSLPVSPAQIISSLVQIIVNIQSTLIHSGNGFHGAANGVGQGSSVLPTSPSGGSTDSMSASRSSCMNTASFVSRSGYTCQQLSCLLIQACGLLLAQLPPEFHTQLYVEASRVTRETWWLSDGKRSQGEVDSAVGYALMDPTWAAQDNTSTAIGNVVALLHAFFSNLPQEWLDGTHLIIKNLRPVTSVAMLRVAFRIMGPLLPRLANTHALFNKTLALLLSTMVDVFGKNSQTPVPVEASQIADLIDFLHHVVHYEGQGGAVQSSSKPRPDTLALIGRAADSLRPDVQHLLSHLRTDPNSSIYAAAHQNTAKTNTS
ncbi:mediator of RNA polymerase II transcription subunit 23 isoform X1 [Brassica napus]|uniref:mediator of RNA polymerase II transcription subunit 23 isoform X1 n=1 Tax=Brassica napus TaxID=3708 RepID=UPI00207AED1F|nr:mediator of RNA polymerase II transcription subunit 23 isoform X1 [Brassica napus]